MLRRLASFSAIALTVLLVPWVIHHIPYFNRSDVSARRVAKGRLPRWVSITELLFLGTSEIALIGLFYLSEASVHRVFHPGLAFLPAVQARLSFDLVFWLIQALAPPMAALPLGMILANLMAWSIPSIRKAENKIIDEGAPGYTWADLNMGLLKAAAITVPASVILALISMMRL